MPASKFWAPGLAALAACAALAVCGPARAAGPSCPDSPLAHIDLRATRVALFHDQPITIVALGSSSTEGSGASGVDHTYPVQLFDRLQAAWPNVHVTVLNKGVGGQMVDSELARIDSDVLPAHPVLVIWQVGTNEILKGMDPAHFAEILHEGVSRILASGADLVLMDSQIAPRLPENRLETYDAIIANEAKARNVPLFSRTALMREWQQEEPLASNMVGPDGVHHTDRGYACLAASLGQSIIEAAAKGVPVASAKKK